ncbi:hypothetical protein E2542_SST26376 [Spatholobus suberectus]|nr:hypothetical protein E2542_SST26376 [Spatholobus suberectus]
MFGVPSEPDSGEIAPTELTLNYIAAGIEGVTNSDSMIVAAVVILGAFALPGETTAVVLVVIVVLEYPISQ